MDGGPRMDALRWIARLSPQNCPGGVPTGDAGWRDLVNRYRIIPPSGLLKIVPRTSSLILTGLPDGSPETGANTVLCLVRQAIYLLKRQIAVQEKTFLEDGGFTERLCNKRRSERRRRC